MPRLRLDIEAAPSYEFALSLAAAAEGGGWQTGIGLAERVAGFAPSEMVWAHLLTVAYDTPPPRDVDSLIKAVRHMHPSELRLRLLGYYVRYFRRATPPEVIAAAARGDRRSARIFLETSYPGDERWQAALRKLLPLDAWQTRRELLDVLVGWRDVFAQNYDPAPLAAEVAARRRHAGSLKAERVIAAVMDGWEYVAEPGIRVRVSLEAQVLRVCDSGSAVPPELERGLLRSPMPSSGGLGIGLYQAARQAEAAGFRLMLETNRDGEVCFALLADLQDQGSRPAPISLP